MSATKEFRYYWKPSQMFKFINLVKKHPQLWDPQHKNYRNQFQRDLGYDELSFEMGTTNEMVKKKVHILRTQFNVELKKMQADSGTKTTWPYFEALIPIFGHKSKNAFKVVEINDESLNKEADEQCECCAQENVDNAENNTPEHVEDQQSLTENEIERPFKWKKQNTLKLIKLYRAHNELYNVFSKDYKNQIKRQESLKSIAAEMNLTVIAIKKKIHALRSMYMAEVRKMKKSKTKEKPKWVLFDELKFLYDKAVYAPRPHLRNKSSHLNEEDSLNSIEADMSCEIDVPEEQMEFIDIDVKSESSIDVNTTTNETNLETIETDTTEAAVPNETNLETIETDTTEAAVPHEEYDEFAIFGEAVASELRQTKDYKEIHHMLKKQILKALQDAKASIAAQSV